MEHTFFIRTFIRMRTEVVTLRLDQVGRQYGSTIAVVVRHCSGEGRHRNTVLYCVCYNITQRLLVFVSNLLEVRRQKQVRDTCIFSIGISDFLQELGADDATCTEDLRDFTVVQIPVVFVRSRAQLRETLRVRDDFAQVQSASNLLNEFRFVSSWFSLRTRQHFGSRNALIFQRRDVTSEYGFSDQRQRFAQVQRALAGPFAGTFVRRFVKNHIDQVFTLFIFLREDIFGDVDQIAVQLAFVPLSEGLCEFFVGKVQAPLQQRVG